jgi:hypothetical protein
MAVYQSFTANSQPRQLVGVIGMITWCELLDVVVYVLLCSTMDVYA